MSLPDSYAGTNGAPPDVSDQGPSASAFLQMSVSLDSLTTELREQNKARARQAGAIHPNELPVLNGVVTGGTVAFGGSGPAFLRPPDGWAWAIQNLIAGGLTGGGGASTSNQGQATAPTPNTSITSLQATLPTGLVRIDWAVGLDGTPGATEVDNFQLRYNANTLEQSVNDGVVGRYPQNSVQTFISNPPASAIVVRNSAAGTAGAIYSAQLTVTAIGSGDTLSVWKGAAGPSQNLRALLTAAAPVVSFGSKGLILRHGQQLLVSGVNLGAAAVTVQGEMIEVREDLLWRYCI